MTIDQSQHADAKGMLLLFAAGKRPTRAAIRQFTEAQRSASISHDPSQSSPLHLVAADGEVQHPIETGPEANGTVWLELLHEGLTFDLHGLAPGEPCDFPEFEHRFDLDRTPGAFRLETLRLQPGQHLAGGEASMPVMKGLIALARDLTHHFEDLAAIVWPPARSVIGRRFFESVATAWLEGGAFPALGLTAFRETIDGALQSVGLEYWIGQELRIEPPLSTDKVAATRLGVRIVNQLVIVGGLAEAERIIAPDGTQLVMRPSRNRKFIRVWRE
ncbi:hypothetical protein [Erythrobacter sp. JK5]|uniref:hypothetical protein n=1 Tax=Erythrobacter sp. JK5 TaxID=2829500 RepID=UPI001BA9881D|nr:hypothetical protein [Erythrobacter sp. JK5]QUL38842.1 hypothetical protein KDC96_05585 [Erythrobacter sp. JK5]